MYIRAYGPTVSGRDRGILKLRTGANTLIRTLAGGENFTTTAGCRTTARPRTATIQEQTLLFFGGGGGGPPPPPPPPWSLPTHSTVGTPFITIVLLKNECYYEDCCCEAPCE